MLQLPSITFRPSTHLTSNQSPGPYEWFPKTLIEQHHRRCNFELSAPIPSRTRATTPFDERSVDRQHCSDKHDVAPIMNPHLLDEMIHQLLCRRCSGTCFNLVSLLSANRGRRNLAANFDRKLERTGGLLITPGSDRTASAAWCAPVTVTSSESPRPNQIPL